ncbi:MAG: M20 family metallopeptidase [Tissierellia bacterium]|nr:M20 family metallopeptidase [Tissierellia bacterium]
MPLSKDLVTRLKKDSQAIYEEVRDLRRHLHMYPDLSQKEEGTARFIMDFLDGIQIPYTYDQETHALVALLEGRDPGTQAIGFRADMDALPIQEKTGLPYASKREGVMHACGHDFHTAILLGLAKVLAPYRNQFFGSLKLFFQPAEETVGGAYDMIKKGCLKDPPVDRVFGLHMDSFLETGHISLLKGSINAASCEFRVRVQGQSSHGAYPFQGIDPLPVACEIVLAFNTLLSRRLPAVEPNLISVGVFNYGQKNNIISQEATFSGIIRTHKLETRDFIKKEMKRLAQAIAYGHGARAYLDFEDSYPNLLNDEGLYERVRDLGLALLGQDRVKTEGAITMGTDDFAYFSHQARAFYFNLGGGHRDRAENFPLHSEYVHLNEESLKTGVFFLAALALEELEAPLTKEDPCDK